MFPKRNLVGELREGRWYCQSEVSDENSIQRQREVLSRFRDRVNAIMKSAQESSKTERK